MKYLRTFLFLITVSFFVSSCQAEPGKVTILDGENVYTLETKERLPLTLFTQAGIAPSPVDRAFFNGIPFPITQPLPPAAFTQLELRRAQNITFITPQGEQTIQTSALTVGDALREMGVPITKNDFIQPPAETPITQQLTITYRPARQLNMAVNGNIFTVYSSAQTVGEALTEAGIHLVGADISIPAEKDALPEDGNIRVVRIYEEIKFALESVPFKTERIENANLPFGQEEITQPGINGLAVTRARIRYEDGKEVSRVTEDKTVVREPQKQIVSGGTQIVTLNLNGMDYWHATEMYATVYSPCASGTGGCSYGTASGARAGYGIVAVDVSAYKYLAGMRVYIPGYGIATIGDTGGGSIIESKLGIPRTKWIDLGFDDGKIINMTGWVTVYFLSPAPAEIPYFLTP